MKYKIYWLNNLSPKIKVSTIISTYLCITKTPTLMKLIRIKFAWTPYASRYNNNPIVFLNFNTVFNKHNNFRFDQRFQFFYQLHKCSTSHRICRQILSIFHFQICLPNKSYQIPMCRLFRLFSQKSILCGVVSW